METLNDAHDLLAAYSRTSGPDGLRFNSDGCARLIFGGGIAVNLEIDRSAGCIQLYGVLGPVPAAGREDLYRKLLEGNLFGSQTRGAWLAIDDRREEVLLCRRVDVGATGATHFSEILESFAGTLGQWLDRWHTEDLTRTCAPNPAQPQDHYVRG